MIRVSHGLLPSHSRTQQRPAYKGDVDIRTSNEIQYTFKGWYRTTKAIEHMAFPIVELWVAGRVPHLPLGPDQE